MARNDAELEQLVAARSPQLRRVSYLIVRDWQRAEDIVRTALTTACAAGARQERKESLEARARRAVVDDSLAWMRTPRREAADDAGSDPHAPADVAQLNEELVAALALMTPEQAAIVALRFVEDLSVPEVAELLGISEGTVKSQSSRGLAKLRTLMQPAGAPSDRQE
jgi:RNA polymerase sigma factor (sigma-70 family)